MGTHQPDRHLHLGCGTSEAQRISVTPPSGGAKACRVSSRPVPLSVRFRTALVPAPYGSTIVSKSGEPVEQASLL
ncbi:hypothetical protein ELG87_34945 (plasmid) [Rhizobium leguminosarum]|nr:hypothetical protein ELG87_34945 [Rhizobium leguminosarum]